MNTTIKNIVIVAVVAIVTFPVMYMIVLFATGYARIEFGFDEMRDTQQQNVKMMERSEEMDSLIARQSKTFEAMVQERARLRKERTRLEQMRTHIQELTDELARQKEQLQQKRQAIEKTVEKSDKLSQDKIKELASIYGTMDAEEAAAILQTIDNDLVIKILKAIRDERQKAEIVAALPRNKASAISKKIGTPPVQNR
jgi:flagellar motility protein MotE (MotC chaperone)